VLRFLLLTTLKTYVFSLGRILAGILKNVGWSKLSVFLLLGTALAGCQPLAMITPPPQDGIGSNSLNSSAVDEQPQLSYNGRYLVFTSERDKRRSIYLYDMTARQIIPLPNLNQAGNYLEQPDISADGRLITFRAEQNGKSNIWLYDRERRQAQNLTPAWRSAVRHPTLSGDGRWVVFESNLNGQWDLVIYDRGSNNIRPFNPGQLPGPDGAP
jgi:Tol biopolymer transport system component